MKRIRLSGDVGWEISPEQVRWLLPKDGQDVVIELYSPGGYVSDGLEIYNLLRDYSGKVTVICGALVASAATIIAMAADELLARETTQFMIHEPWTIMLGTADDLVKEAEILRQIIDIAVLLYAKRSGKSEAELRKALKEELWLAGKGIVDYGFADGLMEDESAPAEGESQAAVLQKMAALKAKLETEGREHSANSGLEGKLLRCAMAQLRGSVKLASDETKEKLQDQAAAPVLEQAKEGQSMTLEELKAQHPALYAQIVAEAKAAGAAEEKDRIEALMVYVDVDPDTVKAAIAEGREFSKKEIAEMNRKEVLALQNQQQEQNLIDDSADNSGGHGQTAAGGGCATSMSVDAAEYQKKLAERYNKGKAQGGA